MGKIGVAGLIHTFREAIGQLRGGQRVVPGRLDEDVEGWLS